MKLIILWVDDGHLCIGAEHPMGRIERLFVSADRIAGEDRDTVKALAERMSAAYNALDGVSDKTIELLNEPATTSGTIAERVIAWSLFTARARLPALRLLKEAREKIRAAKNEGESQI